MACNAKQLRNQKGYKMSAKKHQTKAIQANSRAGFDTVSIAFFSAGAGKAKSWAINLALAVATLFVFTALHTATGSSEQGTKGYFEGEIVANARRNGVHQSIGVEHIKER